MASQEKRTTTGRRPRGAARTALLAAAAAEVNEFGYDGTDSNRIARRAGYAPQTFYRHFADKRSVFIEVYRAWVEEELAQVAQAIGKGPLAAARVLIEHHSRYRGFRRSLRWLTATDPVIRRARATSRRRQMQALSSGEYEGLNRDGQIALLLCIERLADAAAEGELADLGVSPGGQARLLAEAVARLGASEPKVQEGRLRRRIARR